MRTEVVTSRGELERVLVPARRAAKTVAFVPTMGALHGGHARLLELARSRGDVLVASIFVNPLQFGAGEDFDSYPRTFPDDLELASGQGVDLLFVPDQQVMYPTGNPQVSVDPGPLGSRLEGRLRPGHFRGVLTVVATLFGLVRPDAAFFGEKDYQQLVLIRRMAHDLAISVDVVGVPTVRERNGLALATRNRYLSDAQRTAALAFWRALRAGAAAAGSGPTAALGAASAVLAGAPDIELDYLELTDPELGPAPVTGPARLLVAGRVGSTRLLDNSAVLLGPPDFAR